MREEVESSNVLAYLEANVKLRPDKVAVAAGSEEYTFFELERKVRRLSTAIACEGRPVAIVADRSADTVAFELAVAYSGNFYMPIDPEMPGEKMRSILEEADPAYVFCGEKNREKLNAIAGLECRLLGIDSAGESAHVPTRIAADAPLYMIYTSGSTGKPKGVLKTHGAMISFIESYVETFGFGEGEVIGNQTPFFFDASAKDVYLMLRTGARLEIIPAELFVMPPRLMGYLNEKRISYICWVPTALVLTAQMQAFRYVTPRYLRRVYFVGEVMPAKHLGYWMENLPRVQYVNLYGQSEICGIACYYEVPGVPPVDRPLPIGRPMPNCRILLRDEDRTVAEPGCPGEIWIASEALAKGYYRNDAMTARDFVWKDGDRYFRTGDYAYYGEDGCLIFAARKDSQIKHLGRRIELGEIETAAGALPGIERCCCLYDSEHKRIVLFCQGPDMDEAELRQRLSGKLSSYMMPGRIVCMNRLPVNPNGKIDRQRLRESF